MKKIAFIAFDLNPLWGSEAHVGHMWLRAISSDFYVEVFTLSINKDAIEDFDYGPNVKFHYIEINPLLRQFLFKLKLFGTLNRTFIKQLTPILLELCHKKKISLIHFVTPAGIHTYNNIYKKIDIPYLIGPIGGGLKTPPGFSKAFNLNALLSSKLRSLFHISLKYKKTFKNYLKCSSAIIAGTKFIMPIIPVEVHNKVRYIFDTSIEEELKPVPKVHSEKVKLVFCGRLIAIKGITMLIDALGKIKKERPQVWNAIDVKILGDGPLRSKCERHSAKYGLSNRVSFLGKIPRKETLEIVANSDILCNPAIREPGGTAVLEGMALGLPLIVADYGGPSISVTEECGIKIKLTDYATFVEDLALAISLLITNEDLRIRLGEAAKERSIEFSFEALKKRALELYNKLTENRSPK
ncbi:glycosyltransferase family 4 protein [bacterium]|nr:glycosyltransferase family 4 protein [bacterium]